MFALSRSEIQPFSLLRGSGLKYFFLLLSVRVCVVLPLTREWIEMFFFGLPFEGSLVLPLTREWIEIISSKAKLKKHTFSLLRGSGLKLHIYPLRLFTPHVLPLTREWIEINTAKTEDTFLTFSLLRGSGLKCVKPYETALFNAFSLLRGSGLKCFAEIEDNVLFTRSPSYEGVD